MHRRFVALVGPAGLVVLIVALLALIALRPTVAHARGLAESCDTLRELVAGLDLEVGLVLLDLEDGERCSIGADTEFRTASLYKLIVMAEAYEQNRLGLFDFADEIVLEERHTIDDPPSLRLETPLELSRFQAMVRMIQFSDNTSALALREELGSGQVAAAPARIGLEDTQVGLRFVTTAADIATFFELLYAGELVSERASAEMLSILRGQEINDLIPAVLPDGTVIAHKTGLLAGNLHDAGLIATPSGDYVLVTMTGHEPTSAGREIAYAGIHELSAAAYSLMSTIVRPIEPLEELLASPFAFIADRDQLLVVAAELAEARNAVVGSSGTASATVGAPLAAASGQGEPVVSAAEGSIDASTGTASVGARAEQAVGSGGAAAGAGSLGAAITDSSVPWWRGASTLALLLVTLAVVVGPIGTILIRRREFPRYAWANGGPNGAAERMARAGRGVAMRIGGKFRNLPAADGSTDVVPATTTVTQVSEVPVLPSARLQRIAEHFITQSELLSEMRAQIEQETAPLQELLIRQASTMQQLLANLEERLRPLNEYADHEEANLAALEQRINDQGADFVSRSFQEYLRQQTLRIAETRQQIDEQRMPFLRYAEDQREAVEVALSRYDGQMDELEKNLAEQRTTMMRMVDEMRSDTFVAIRQFLADRETAMAGLAAAGAADPTEVAASIKVLRESIESLAGESPEVKSVLETADSADARLTETLTPPRPQALPDATENTPVSNTPVSGRQGATAAAAATREAEDDGKQSKATA